MKDVLNSNLVQLNQSVSVAFADFVRDCERNGAKIVKMQTGDPDFPTHPKVIEIAHRAMVAGETKYSDSRGLVKFRGAILEKLERENGYKGLSLNNVLVTHGAVHGVQIAIRTLLNPGDECIILEPYWMAYRADIILCGGVPVVVQLSAENGFDLNVDLVASKISRKTKAIIINSPNNPSGAVYLKADLQKLADLAIANGIIIITDEVYENILLSDRPHFSLGASKKCFGHVISVFSLSKTYAMTGWRLGYVVAEERIISEMLKLGQFSVTNIAPFSQTAGALALSDSEVASFSVKMEETYNQRLDRIMRLISGTWLEEAMSRPNGTFYALIDVSRFGEDCMVIAKKLVTDYGVALTPGHAFGEGMKQYLRLCFATNDENIDSAISALVQLARDFGD